MAHRHEDVSSSKTVASTRSHSTWIFNLSTTKAAYEINNNGNKIRGWINSQIFSPLPAMRHGGGGAALKNLGRI